MTKHALITGGTRGIGYQIACKFKAEGYRVTVCDIAYERMTSFRPSEDIACIAIDVANFNDVSRKVETLERTIAPIDILVNNAGITRDGMMHRMDPESQWNAVISVNLTGVFNMCRTIVPGMRERGFGRIVNISSMNGQRGQFGQANYAAAKAGIIAFTKSIALETASKGITANCIAPGLIDTEMTKAMKADIREAETAKIPVGRMGTPKDIADAAHFLALDEAGFITGETLSVNGGQLMT